MSCNKNYPHVLVLPEDGANRQLANGFRSQLLGNRQRQMQIQQVAGGWTKVLDRFGSVHVPEMDRFATRFMVLLIDLDGHKERLQEAQDRVPHRLADRVFILGALTKPEALKANLGSYETIGSGLARDCREDTYEKWGHPLLQHNAAELERLRQHVRPILF